MTKLMLLLLLSLYLFINQREWQQKSLWLRLSLLGLIGLSLAFSLVWLSLLSLFIVNLVFYFVEQKNLPLLGLSSLSGLNGLLSFWQPSWLLPSLLLTLIIIDGFYFIRRSNWQLALSNFVFELVISGLMISVELKDKIGLLVLFSVYVLMLQQMFAYLFKETDMVYARSLDQIMANYIEEVDVLYQNVRGWRHDYHSHLQALKAYVAQDQVGEIKGYLNELESDLIEIDQIVKSGNTMLDAIVNSKLSIASQKGIEMNVKVFVGQQPLINDVDLCVILGNILDNGIEACEEIEHVEERMMRVYISILKQQLYISVTNSRPLSQEIQVDYLSTKNDKRGLGIRRINQLVAKYDGVINRQYEKEVFVTEILLPLATISER